MIIYFIIILAIATRLVPHMANVGIVTALGMFAAVYLSKKQAVGLVLTVRLVSDLFLGFFSWPLMLAVYGSHLVGVLFGAWIKNSLDKPGAKRLKIFGSGARPAAKWAKIFGSAVATAAIFFLVTNFAFLYASYPHTWAGITQAYINGLPFLRGTLIGDVGYAVALFGAYDLVRYLANRRQAAGRAGRKVQNQNF